MFPTSRSNAAVAITYQLARLAGDHALARAMAEKSGREDFREAAYFDAGDWTKLGALPTPSNTSYPAAILGLRLMYQHLAGQPVAATVEALKKQPPDTSAVFIPSRVFRGQRMAGRMGGGSVTVKNLRIAKIDVEKGLIMINGAVPGKPDAILRIRGR